MWSKIGSRTVLLFAFLFITIGCLKVSAKHSLNIDTGSPNVKLENSQLLPPQNPTFAILSTPKPSEPSPSAPTTRKIEYKQNAKPSFGVEYATFWVGTSLAIAAVAISLLMVILFILYLYLGLHREEEM